MPTKVVRPEGPKYINRDARLVTGERVRVVESWLGGSTSYSFPHYTVRAIQDDGTLGEGFVVNPARIVWEIR